MNITYLTNPFTQQMYKLNMQQLDAKQNNGTDEELELALQEWEERTKLIPFTATGQLRNVPLAVWMIWTLGIQPTAIGD